MKNFKTLCILIIAILISVIGFSQQAPIYYSLPVTENQCLPFAAPTGYAVDSARIVSAPVHGNLTNVTDTSFTYCPDLNFYGVDHMVLYACLNGNGMLACDTINITYNVQYDSLASHSILTFTELASEGACNTYTTNPNNGYTLSNIQLLSNPQWGSISSTSPLIYCAPTNFTGLDSALIYACQSLNGVYQGCDTFKVYFNVHTPFSTYVVQMQENHCDTFTNVSGINIDSLQVFSWPQNGTMTINSAHTQLTYCPNQNFIGSDSALIFACVPGLTCDTLNLVFNVQHVCSLTLTIVADSACSGTGEHYTAEVSNGTQPYTYAWTDGTLTPGNCVLNGGSPCLTVTDSYGCATTACSNSLSAQLSFTEYDTAGHCDTFSINPNNGYLLNNIQVQGGPMHGTFTASGMPLQYCANAGYTGLDTVFLTGCQSANGINVACGTFEIYFWIQNPDQYHQRTIQVNENHCDTFNNVSGETLDSLQAFTQAQHGSVTINPAHTALVYCPNTGFTGLDSIWAFSCGSNNNGLFVCDSFELIFNVQASHPSYTIQMLENTCDTFNTVSGITVDSIRIFSPPLNGTASVNLLGTSLVYCPSQGFVGTDSALVALCVPGLFCDTIWLVFNVTSNCSLTITMADSTDLNGGGLYLYPIISGGPPPYGYYWSDGGRGPQEPWNGSTNLCITVTDGNGCTASGCGSTCPTSASFTYNPTGCNGQGSITINTVGGEGPFTYDWSTNENGATICTANGEGVYCVYVYNNYGCSAASYCDTVMAPNICSFQYAQPYTDSQLVYFYSNYDTQDTLLYLSWNFGDNIVLNTLANPATHNYTNPGTYYVTMVAHYINGDTCSSSQYVYVASGSNNVYPFCQASFTSYVSGDTVYFHDQSVYTPTSWQWDFGDGTGSTLQNPYHIYASQGVQNVCLTIITDTINGNTACSATWCDTVNSSLVQDMVGYLFHASTVTPGYPLYVYLVYYNNGTTDMSGQVNYEYPAGTTFVSATPAPAFINTTTHSMQFDYSGILPGQSGYIFVDLAADSNLALASLVYDSMVVQPLLGDVNPANNISTVIDSVVGSWDPNAKSVSPKGRGEKGLIEATTQEVSYMIHFQNTGNGPAHQVVIRDTISDYIDLATVKVTYTSFACVTQVIGNVLVVSFENINLPDTATSLLASQGYINVMANLKPGLEGGTQIFNTGYIYFDANAPVITNTVVNTLPGGPTGIINMGNLQFALMPNPANNTVMIRGDFDAASTYEVVDMLGQPLLKGTMLLTGADLNIGTLSAGVYLVKVNSGVKTGAKRLVVVR